MDPLRQAGGFKPTLFMVASGSSHICPMPITTTQTGVIIILIPIIIAIVMPLRSFVSCDNPFGQWWWSVSVSNDNVQCLQSGHSPDSLFAHKSSCSLLTLRNGVMSFGCGRHAPRRSSQSEHTENGIFQESICLSETHYDLSQIG